jgi:hypothetical protein
VGVGLFFCVKLADCFIVSTTFKNQGVALNKMYRSGTKIYRGGVGTPVIWISGIALPC